MSLDLPPQSENGILPSFLETLADLDIPVTTGDIIELYKLASTTFQSLPEVVFFQGRYFEKESMEVEPLLVQYAKGFVSGFENDPNKMLSSPFEKSMYDGGYYFGINVSRAKRLS